MRREHALDLGQPLIAPRQVDLERRELVPLGLVDRVRRVGDHQIDRAVVELAEQGHGVGVPQLAPRRAPGHQRDGRPGARQILRDGELADDARRTLGHGGTLADRSDAGDGRAGDGR